MKTYNITYESIKRVLKGKINMLIFLEEKIVMYEETLNKTMKR